MVKKTVKFNLINDIKAFNQAVVKCSFDVDLVSGRYVIDAKSLMGIFTLDLSRPIDLHIHAEETDEETIAFLNAISNYLV